MGPTEISRMETNMEMGEGALAFVLQCGLCICRQGTLHQLFIAKYCICTNGKMYLFKLTNILVKIDKLCLSILTFVFVNIAKCICT